MSRSLIASFIFTVGFFSAKAQIVNIEALRSAEDTNGFHGLENFNVNYTRNTKELLTLTNNLSLQYKKERNVWLFLNSLDVSMANNTILEQSSFFHLRYNYIKNNWLTYEALAQYQSDVPLRIKKRILTGLGPRFTFFKKEMQALYLGTLVIYEYEDELSSDIVHNDVRLSAYLSFNLSLKERLRWTAIAYYQPRVDKWEDFRTSIQTSLSLKIIKNLFFTTTLSLAYDAYPVVDPNIPNLTVKWVNGLSYKF